MSLEGFLFQFVVILLLVLVNAFFVGAEFSIVRLRLTELDAYISEGHQTAKRAKMLVDNLDEYISATQLGITIANLILGWIGEDVFSKISAPILAHFGIQSQLLHTLSIVFGIMIITFFTVTLGELTPKTIAIRFPLKIALWFSIPLTLFYRIFKPFIMLLNYSSRLVIRIIGIQPVQKGEILHSEAEIRQIISEGRKSGVIDQTEHQLIEKIFEFNDKQADEIMVPRNLMIALNIDDSREEIFQIVTEEGFSRLPVYKDTIDNIIGVIYTKDLISASEHRELIALQDIIRPAFFVSSTKQIGNLLKEMQRGKVHMAIVVDEYGGVEGLITIEDIIEEIVGEIQDEYDVDPQEVITEKSGVYLVNPIIAIEDFNKRFNSFIPEDPDYHTLSGFLQKVTGHIPEIHERIDYKGMSFVITKKTANTILQARVQKI
jgi:CBS domain containing-hemolysin-like protein